MKKLIGILSILLMFGTSVYAGDMRFVQITDVRYSEANKDNLKSVIKDVNKLSDVKFVVFTGDNLIKPSKEELLGFIKTAKHLKMPFYVVIGDKDVNRRKEMSKKQYTEILHKKIMGYKPKTPNYTFIKNGVVFMVADGSKDVIPDTIGYYRDNVLEWADANLDVYSKKNVIILQHFPLVPPYERENYNTYKADKYLEILKNHPNVKAVVSGHYGVNKEQTVDGIVHISTAPIPNYRIIDILDYDTKNPTIWTEVKTAKSYVKKEDK